MKTIYSRFQNAAAGKFVASQEEIESEDYNEEEWTAINDIEKALRAVGVQVRDTVNDFRDVDDILGELAEKWDSLTSLQQSGVATSVAGTRQRENFLVLMENWDLASKYAEISANAYGTAAEKMEAYTDSIEAAQNRVTVAVEGFAQKWNSSNLLKGFYSAMAYVIENLDKLAGAIGLVIAATQGGAILRGVSGGLATLGGKSAGLSSFMNILQTPSNWKGSFKQAKNNFVTRVNEDYTETLIAQYNTALEKRTASLTAEDAQAAKALQNDILRQDAQVRSLQTQYLLGDISEDEYKAKVQNTLAYKQATLALKEEMLSTENLKKAKDKNYAQIVAQNTKGFNQASQTTGMQAMKNGLFMLGGGAFGTFAGSTLAEEYLGEGAGIYGGMLGGLIGGAGGNSLNNFFGNLKQAKEEVKSLREQLEFLQSDEGFNQYGENVTNLIDTVREQLSTAEQGTNLFNPKTLLNLFGGPVGVATTAITLATTFWSFWNKYQEGQIKKTQEEFKELNDEFTNQLNSQPDAIKYDDLVKGVDSLGNNVSLTEDEYQQFLDTSNALAEVFPNLVVRIDEAGNKFLGLNGRVTSVSDSIEQLTKQTQLLADDKLLTKNIFGQQLKEDQKNLEKLQKTVTTAENSYAYYAEQSADENLTETTRQNYAEMAEDAFKRFQEAKEELNSYEVDYTDYIQASIRDNTALSKSYEELTDEERQWVDLATQAIDFSKFDENDTAKAIEYIQNIAENAMDSFKKIQDDFDIYLNIDSTMPASEYENARNALRDMILSMPGMTEDEKGNFLQAIGFTFDENLNKWTDSTNPLDAIFNEGLNNKVLGADGKAMSKSVMGALYSVEQLQYAYEILKDREDDAAYSAEQFQNVVVTTQVMHSELTELATDYEKLTKQAEDGLTTVQQIQKQIIEEQLDQYAKQLGAVEGHYDEIIKKIKEQGNLTYGGTSEMTPDEVLDKYETYTDIYEALKDYEGGNVAVETMNQILGEDELAPFANNIEKVKEILRQFLEQDANNLYQNAVQGAVIATEAGSQQILSMAGDLVDAFEEDYGIDLNNYQTLKEAEVQLDALATAQMTDNYEDWVSALYTYYQEDLANFTDAVSKKAALNSILANTLDISDENLKGMKRTYTAQGYSDAEATEMVNKLLYGMQAEKDAAEMQKRLQEIIDVFHVNTDFTNVSGGSGSGSDDEFTYDDLLDALESLIDKEWEAMQVFDEMTGKVTGETAYFTKMEDLLDKKIAYYKAQAASALAEGDQATYYDYQAKLIQAEVDLANLDDERLQDELDLAEAKGYSLDAMIKLYQEYVKTADTEEDRVEYQNKLNDAIREEYEERKRIREFEQSFIETALDRQSGTAWSDSGTYESLINAQMESYVRDAEAAQAEITRLTQQWIGTYMEQGKSYDQAKELAGMTEDVQDATQDYLDAIEKQAELTITRVTDKLDEIEQRISDLEASKPQEWTSIDQIRDFSEQTIALLEAKIPEIKKGLEDVSMLTDEQIQELVDQLNDASTALMEAQINMREEIQSYQENQFSAVEWAVEEIIEGLNQDMEDVEDAYQPLIDQLEEVNDEKERSAELDDLLLAKRNALNEKQRVKLYALVIKIAI